MAELKKLDQLNKPQQHEDNNSWKTNPPLNKSNPEFAKPEKIAKTILAMGGAKKGPKASAPSPASELNIKLAKIRKIKLYLQHFPKLDEANIRVPSINASDKEIDEILFDIHKFMNTVTGERYVPILMQQMFYGLENLTMVQGVNPMGWDLTNLHKIPSHPEASKKLNEVALELYIEYEEWFSMGPWSRLVAEVFGLMMAVDKNNKMMKNIINDAQSKMMEEERQAMMKDPDDNSSSK